MNKLQRLPLWLTYSLLVYMPFHVFLSTWLSTYTGGLEIWKAAKDILVLVLAPVLAWVAYKQRLFRQKTFRILFCLTLLYGAVHGVWVFNHLLDRPTLFEAFVYNNRLLWYVLIGYLAGSVSQKQPKNLIKLILGVSTIVAFLGVLQYFLPKDFLTHFGYSVTRGVKPNFFIDDRPSLPRIMSTLRDPNSLGAYLVLPSLLLSYLALKKPSKSLLILGLLTLHLLALFLTFSRGALIGLGLGYVVVGYLTYRKHIASWMKNNVLLIAVIVSVFTAFFIVGRNSSVVQNYLLHRTTSTVQADPNQLRVELQKKAAKSVLHKPFGHGPGTAGIVSIRNPKTSLLTENYYLQIAYEVGFPGLLIFIVVLVEVYRALLHVAKVNSLQPVLIASFWSYVAVALLIHLWSNEAVAAQWWLVAGVVVGANNTTKSLRSPV